MGDGGSDRNPVHCEIIEGAALDLDGIIIGAIISLESIKYLSNGSIPVKICFRLISEMCDSNLFIFIHDGLILLIVTCCELVFHESDQKVLQSSHQ